MVLPADSRRGRVFWSIPAFLILALWTIGIWGAGATSFIQPYTFPEVLSEIAQGRSRMFWPGEFGYHWYGFMFQLGYLIAALLWSFCLVPWRTRARRVTALVIALLVPAYPVLLIPLWDDFQFSMPFQLIFGVGYGEEWQDGYVVVPAMALWWLLLVPLIVLTTGRGPLWIGIGCCSGCGYSTIGLTGNICPECRNTLGHNARAHASASLERDVEATD